MFDTRLHEAARRGDIGALDAALADGADPNGADRSGETAMHAAARSSNVDILQRLARVGADANARDHQGRTPMHVAAASGTGIGAALRRLIDLGGRLDVADAGGVSPIQWYFLHNCDDPPTERNEARLNHLSMILFYWNGSHDRAPAIPGTGAKTLRELRGDPVDVDALLTIAEESRVAGLWMRAIELCERALQVNPTLAGVHSALGTIYRKVDDSRGEIAGAWWALQLEPHKTGRWMRVTHLLIESGQLERAQDVVDAGVARHPRFSDLHYNRACVCALRGDKAGLLASAERAIALKSAQRADFRDDRDLGDFLDDPDVIDLLREP